ncbi:hypothetical protein SAMN04488109_6850 [Chryseolinea serpens]|uniref:DUF4350 domain-containing protein n=1 Tax=Chryseolinea serpens TaxID=947013 RepID=A0A1M5XTZ6_9BACT|nr:DUF4350 domain-containing protein [Chryseolinea serpens]SHI03014.1 hypothetical protein SAMN04488109_6850 [Chryseolinea serpens]
MKETFLLLVLAFALTITPSRAQQVPDSAFEPKIKSPSHPPDKGPILFIDEAHHNFHTIETRYLAFAKVLRRDGYQVQPNKTPFSLSSLKKASVLVIANAIHPSNETVWAEPILPAFTPAEIEAVKKWVDDGGSLLLIADHMPFPDAATDLAKAFGFTFYNGFATDTTAGLYPGAKRELDVFTASSGALANHAITKGKTSGERVERVATFTGQAFQIPSRATSLLTFDDRYKILLPDTAWKFNAGTKRIPIKGFSQGAILEYGKGRVAVFGEAAMFTAQLKGKDKVPFGLNSPDAQQNLQFLLNLIHWLDHKGNPK